MTNGIPKKALITAAYAKRLKSERKYITKQIVPDEMVRVPHPTLKNTWILRKKESVKNPNTLLQV